MRLSHNMLYVDGKSKLANGLVNDQADSYTVLEKRASCENRASFKDRCRRMPDAHCER
jgi:hypothetical protein